MAKKPETKKAEQIGLHDGEVRILRIVAGWFAGRTFRNENISYNIGTGPEPPLAQLARTVGWYFNGFEQVHNQMIEKGLFKTETRGENVYIAGRRCDWLPTENCLSIIEHIFSHYTDGITAPWVDDEHTGSPIYRDGSELMVHRKGVLAAKKHFFQLEQIGGVYVYPRPGDENRPDLWLVRPKGQLIARVEVLSNHNKRQSWESKFDAWRNKDGCTIWVVENRRAMVQFLNHFVRQGIFELDGGQFTGEPNNWAPERVNARLQRSRKGRYGYNSHDAITTIPSVLQGGKLEALKFIDRNDIIHFTSHSDA